MNASFRTLDDVRVEDARILLRGDLNVPMQNGVVSDSTRLQRLAITINELTGKKARVIILSHFGRPKGTPEEGMSLKPVAEELAKILKKPVTFCPELIGVVAEQAVAAMKPGDVMVMENTRFYKGEEKNDPEFCRAVAKLGDVYVNDAFSVAHRAHMSTEGLAHILPSCAGRDMEAEVRAISTALENPQRPLGAIVGGSKISTKLDLLKNLTAKVDVLVLGGAMANTFLGAVGKNVGASMHEPDMYETARTIMAESAKRGCDIILPVDLVVAKELKPNVETQTVLVDAIPADGRAMDAGPESISRVGEALSRCKTIVWNGPMGVFEVPPFNKGTDALGEIIAGLTQSGRAMSIAGGGDTASAINQAGVADKLTYMSTAGGAFLEWLEGRALPGVEILRKKDAKLKQVAG